MSAQHTPARMKFVGNRGLRDADGKLFAVFVGDNFDQMEGDARRLAACWNACDGIDTEALENITLVGDTLASRFQAREDIEHQISVQRDELLAALKEVADTFGEDWLEGSTQRRLGDLARAAIAKVEASK